MKALVILVSMFASTTVFGQQNNGATTSLKVDAEKKPSANTSLQVHYVYKNKTAQLPAFFINGTFIITDGILSTLEPNQIESINVIKKDTVIDQVTYMGQVFVTMKKEYAPQFISLTDLKNKYTDFKDRSVLFMLDGNVIKGNFDNYKVDENTLLTIVVDKVYIGDEKTELGVIKLITKSEEKNRNRIMIRGVEVSKNN